MMPNFQTHQTLTKISGFLAVPVCIGLNSLGIGPNWLEFALLEAGVVLTLRLDPDLDVRHKLGWFGNEIGLDLYRSIIPHRKGMRTKHWLLAPSRL